jgi:hypothetical protein
MVNSFVFCAGCYNRITCGTKREKTTGDSVKLHDEQLGNFYCNQYDLGQSENGGKSEN